MIGIAVILGLALAATFAFMVTMHLVCKSNVLGDSKGSFYHFTGRSLSMISRSDGVRPSDF